MNRPNSADSRSRGPLRSSNSINYENELVDKYFNNIINKENERKTYDSQKNKKISPYLQKVVQMTHPPRRPSSGVKHLPVKRCTSAKKIRTTTIENHNTEFNSSLCKEFFMNNNSDTHDTSSGHYTKQKRALSRQKTNLYRSSSVTNFRPQSANNESNKIYHKSIVIKVYAYKNGSNENPCVITAHNLKNLLEISTDRLELPRAARRLFYSNGVEIVDTNEIEFNSEVYVSCGEDFIDPYIKNREGIHLRNKKYSWTIDGILNKEAEEKQVKRTASDIDLSGMHLLSAYENGISTDAVIVNAAVEETKDDDEHKKKHNCHQTSELSFKNKDELNHEKDNMTLFLEKCTETLKLSSVIKQVYDWEGNLIEKLNQIPTFNNILSIKNGYVEFTPLWVTKGESFNPTGALRYVIEFINYEKKYLDDLKEFERNIKRGTGKRTFQRREYETLRINQLLDDDKDEIKKLIQYLEELKTRLEELYASYIDNGGSRHLMRHIKEISTNDAIFGGRASKGLKLKVHQNGSNNLLGVIYFNRKDVTDARQGVIQLLDELNRISYRNRTTTGKFTRLFKENGDEITWLTDDNIYYDQKIWVSNGENWKYPFDRVLTLTMFSLNLYKNEQNEAQIDFYAELLRSADIQRSIKPSSWECIEVDEIVRQLKRNLILDVQEKPSDFGEETKLRIAERDISCCLECRDRHETILYPYLGYEQKNSKSFSHRKNNYLAEKWSENNFQVWSLSRDGFIYNEFLPQITMAIDTSLHVELEIQVNSKPFKFTGYCVVLKPKNVNINENLWSLNTKAQIFSKLTGDNMVMTSLHLLREELDNSKIKYKLSSTAQLFDPKTSLGVSAVVMERFDVHKTSFVKKLAPTQRWGIKENGLKWTYPNNLSKHLQLSKLATPEWHMLAYSWPVDENNKLIDEFEWPINGFLIPGAPALRNLDDKENATRLYLKVLKNGETNSLLAVDVLTPDLKKLAEKHEHCAKVTLKEAEFNAFLDTCTMVLNLPFAGRRLFDSKGKEYFDLRCLEHSKERNGLFYVTCGEAWIDPKIAKTDLENMTKAGRLLEDFKKIYHYCSLLACKSVELAIEAQSLSEGAPLFLQTCFLDSRQRERIKQGESLHHVIQSEEMEVIEQQQEKSKSAHERSHENVGVGRKIKWPWENIANRSIEGMITTGESFVVRPEEISASIEKKLTDKNKRILLQKFAYDERTGYIYSVDSPNLVFGVETSEAKVNQVILMYKNENNIHQRWSFDGSGHIVLKTRPHLVLTIHLTPSDSVTRNAITDLSSDKEKYIYLKDIFSGSQITLQNCISTDTGGAHQKWLLDKDFGFLYGLQAKITDIKITAAIQANICTQLVHDAEISQPGYLCNLPSDIIKKSHSKQTKKFICISCANLSRGKFKLTKISNKQKFVCFACKDLTLQQLTGFKYFKNTTQDDMENLLQKCKDEFNELKKKTESSTPFTEVLDERAQNIIKFLVRKNGDGYNRDGELICGSNIQVLLTDATLRLSMGSAARRFYTVDGTLVLDSQDVINFCRTYYRSVVDELQKDGVSDNLKIYENGPTLFQLKKMFGTVEYDEDLDAKTLLKWPIHVWASSGEAFIEPNVVEKNENNRRDQRKRIDELENNLVKNAHVLRQMTGRRYKDLNPGELKGVQNPVYPVIKEGHWKDIPYEEQMKEMEVEYLKTKLDKFRLPSKNTSTAQPVSEEEKKLNALAEPIGVNKRVLIYKNGHPFTEAIYCWGSHMDDLLQAAQMALHIRKPIKYFYDENGSIISKFNDIKYDQLLCVSTGGEFIKPEDINKEIEMKANWYRIRKTSGENATSIRVVSNRNPIVDVDPFGPPMLTAKSAIAFKDDIQTTIENNEHYRALRSLKFHTDELIE